MDEIVCFEGGANRPDSAVHHVAGRDDVNACFSLNQSLLSEDFDGDVVHDIAVFIDNTILPVAGVGVEGDIGEQAQLREVLFKAGDDSRNQSFGVDGLGTIERFERRIDDGKQRHHRDAELNALARHLQNRVGRVAMHAWHRRDRLTHACAFDNKNRINQIIYR